MPPLGLLPNQPAGYPDIVSYGYGSGVGAPASSGGFTSVDADTFSSAIERMREVADREYELNKRKAKQEYELALSRARTERDVAKANERYQQAQAENARERLAFDRESTAARLQFDRENAAARLAFERESTADRLAFDRDSTAARLAFDTDAFARTHGLNQSRLGYDLLNMAANMRGAENYFQASNFRRGVANDPNSSTFLTALQNNVRLPDFTAQYAAPDANTLSALSAKLGTPLGAGAPNAAAPAGADNAYLRQIHALAAAGGHKIGNGGLEQLSGDELKLLKSGMEAPLVGPDGRETAYNFDDFLTQYRNSRIGQSIGGGYRAA